MGIYSGGKETQCGIISIPNVTGYRGGARRGHKKGFRKGRKHAIYWLQRLDRLHILRTIYCRCYLRNVPVLLASAYRPSLNRLAEGV